MASPQFHKDFLDASIQPFGLAGKHAAAADLSISILRTADSTRPTAWDR
jgi:hypothetical protein